MPKPSRPALGGSGQTAWAAFVHDGIVDPYMDDTGDLVLPLSETLPVGGTAGQVITKTGATDGAAAWNDPQGPTGPAGMVWRGDWDALAVYEATDAVAHGGDSWIATGATAAGEEPGVSAKWDLLAQAATINGGTLSADLDAAGFRVLGLPVPSAVGDAAPKGYVDDAIDSATSVSMRAHKAGSAQPISATTFTKVTFGTAAHDDTGGYNPATSTFTAQKTRPHSVSARADATLADGQRMFLAVYVNGTAHSRLDDASAGVAGAGARHGSVPIKLTAGDTVEIYAWSSAAEDIQAGSALTYFTVVQL